MKLRYLLVLLLIIGCASVGTGQNPSGKLTTLPYESEIDPNVFYNYDVVEVRPVLFSDSTIGTAYFLTDPDKKLESIVIILDVNEIMIAYGWGFNDEIFVYELNEDKTKYIRYVPVFEIIEDKEGGV